MATYKVFCLGSAKIIPNWKRKKNGGLGGRSLIIWTWANCLKKITACVQEFCSAAFLQRPWAVLLGPCTTASSCQSQDLSRGALSKSGGHPKDGSWSAGHSGSGNKPEALACRKVFRRTEGVLLRAWLGPRGRDYGDRILLSVLEISHRLVSWWNGCFLWSSMLSSESTPQGDSPPLWLGQWEKSCIMAGRWLRSPKLLANKSFCEQFSKREKNNSVYTLTFTLSLRRSVLVPSARAFSPVLASPPFLSACQFTVSSLWPLADSCSRLQQNF